MSKRSTNPIYRRETARKDTTMNNENHEVLLRLPQVLQLIPVSRSAWWAGVASGRFPASVKLGERTTCWRRSDILKLIDTLR